MSENRSDLDDLFETKPSQTPIQSKPQVSQKPLSDEITYSPSRANNYRTIKSVAFLFYIGAIISFVLGAFSLFGIVTAFENAVVSFEQYGVPSADVFIYGFFFMTAMSISLVFVFLSESVNLFLDIEANSRQSAKTLERILRSQNPD